MKPDWNALQHRLSGAVVGAPDYGVARWSAIARFADARPEAVVFAAMAADVAATIQFARSWGVLATSHIRSRSGKETQLI